MFGFFFVFNIQQIENRNPQKPYKTKAKQHKTNKLLLSLVLPRWKYELLISTFIIKSTSQIQQKNEISEGGST